VMVARERDKGGVALHCTLGGATAGDSISIYRIQFKADTARLSSPP
jgi:hypothetical protein